MDQRDRHTNHQKKDEINKFTLRYDLLYALPGNTEILKFTLPDLTATIKGISNNINSNTDKLEELIAIWEEKCQEIKDTYFNWNDGFKKKKRS